MAQREDYTKDIATFLTDKPMAFSIDPDIGLARLTFVSGYGLASSDAQFEMQMSLILTPAAAQALLSDLPKLQSVLEEAAKGLAKPRSVQ